MKHQIIRFSAIALLLLSVTTFAQSVGIGTETPNANAILELVAPNGDQGLLVPRMNTSARTASTFTNNLSPTDNGLLVFDEEENKFYFWMTDQWVEMASGNLESLPDQTGQSNKYLTTDGTNALWANIDFTSLSNIPTGLSDGDNDTQLSDTDIEALGYIKSADDADADSSNEIQDLTLSGNTLSLTSSTVGVDLSPFSGTNTDNQTMSLTGSNLTISGGNTIDISGVNTVLTEAEVDVFANNNGYLLVEVDGSTTNEVNTGMSLSGTTIQVTDANSTQGVNIDGTFATDSELAASDAADDDKDASNEIQDISTNGSAGNISLSSGATLNLNVDDADADDTNEFQTISKTGNTVTLSNSGGSFSVDDDDSSTSNEIQDISTNGSAGNISLSSGATLNLNVDDTDADNTNEFQDLSLSGSTLSLSNSSETIDLSPFSGTNTDNQTLGLSGSNLSITGGNTIDISSIDTQLSEAVVDGYANNNGYLLAEVDGSTTNEVNTGMSLSGTTISVSDANSTQSVNIGGTFATDAELASSDAADGDKSASNEIQDISTNGTSGNITLSSGSTLNLNVNDADADDSNEFQTVSKTGTTVTLSDGGGSFSVADNDNSTSNEIQNISTNGTAGNITLSSGSTLSLNVNDGDADDSNEFQTVSKTGTTVTLSDGGGSFSVADNDNSTSNEIQNISTNGTAGNITLSSGSTLNLNVNDGDADDSNEFQTVSKTGTTVTLSDGGGSFSVADNDNSTSNEIQNISTNGTAGNITLSSGSTLNLNVNDGDADDSNEFQTVSKTGTTVTLSNGGGSFSVADNDNSSSNEYNSGMSLSGTSIRVTDGGGTRSVNIGGTFATDAELDSRTFSPSAFKATMKAGNIPVGVTNLTFETEAYDIDGSYDASSGVFTVPEDGLYNFGGLMIFSNVPSGLVQIVIRDAGSNILLSKVYAPNTIQSSISFSVDLQLKAGDEIGIALSNTTLGGNEAQPIQTIAAPDVSNFFFCAKRFN